MTAAATGDIESYLQGIRFVHWQPDQPVTGLVGMMDRFRPGRLSLDFRNTRLPTQESRTRERLIHLKGVPRMSTMAIGAVINRAVEAMRDDHVYVNVGVWNGFTFLAGCVGNPGKRCVGVDDFSQYGGPREPFLRRFERVKGPSHRFHEMDYRDYFRKVHEGSLGLYYYDGEHSYENQLEGLEVAEPFFGQGCIVLVDDTNGGNARQATLDFMEERPGEFDLLLDRTTAYPGHPTWWNGLMVLRKRN